MPAPNTDGHSGVWRPLWREQVQGPPQDNLDEDGAAVVDFAMSRPIHSAFTSAEEMSWQPVRREMAAGEVRSAVTGGEVKGSRRYVSVAQEIMAAIGAGRLGPGDRLPNERELSAITGSSRPTVRDALLALELLGVVEVRPGSGAYVTSNGARRPGTPVMFDSPPRELLVAREQIEPAVARLCAGRVPADEVVRLSALIDACEEEGRRAGQDQFEEFLRLSHRFHQALALNCGNSILAEVTRQMVDVAAHPLWMVVNGMLVRDPDARRAQVAEHRAILAAVEAADGELAAQAMADHLGGLSSRVFGGSRSPRTIRRKHRRADRLV